MGQFSVLSKNVNLASNRGALMKEIRKCGHNYSWSLTRIRYRKRPHGKTIEPGHLRELQKTQLFNESLYLI